MTPVTFGKRGDLKRRRTADDKQMKPAKQLKGRTAAVCMECNNKIYASSTAHLAQHSTMHLDFRPFKCSTCNDTTSRKGNLQRHLQKLHQGNGKVIDARTGEYYDALESTTKLNFPDHRGAISSYFRGQKQASGEDGKHV